MNNLAWLRRIVKKLQTIRYIHTGQLLIYCLIIVLGGSCPAAAAGECLFIHISGDLNCNAQNNITNYYNKWPVDLKIVSIFLGNYGQIALIECRHFFYCSPDNCNGQRLDRCGQPAVTPLCNKSAKGESNINSGWFDSIKFIVFDFDLGELLPPITWFCGWLAVVNFHASTLWKL